jgi:membrane-associated protein
VNSIVSGLTHLSGWLAYTVIGALVFGETAVFLGFVLPGETAAVLGGVLASRGHASLATLCVVVVVAAVTGPLVGYEIGRRGGDRLFAARALRRVPGGAERARSVLRDRGGLAVVLGRFVAFLRAVMPAAAGAVRVPYRTFLIYNVVGGVVWGVGYCLLGYLAGSAYSAVESRIGTGLAIAVAAIVVAAVVVWTVRRHRAARGSAAAPDSGAAADSTAASDSNAAADSPAAPDGVPASGLNAARGSAAVPTPAPGRASVPGDGAAPESATAPGHGAAEPPNPSP